MTNQLTLVPRGRRCRRFAAVVAVALALLAASSFEPSPAASPRIGLILNEPEAFEGYTLFNRRRSKAVYLIDNLGRLVHQWNLSTPTVFAKLLENGNLLVSGSDKINQSYNGVREVDPDGNVVWDYVHVGQHHDFVKLPNGNVLLLSEETRTVAEAVAAGANPRITVGDRLRATRVVEVRPIGPADGEIVWEWSAWDHLVQDFDLGKPNYGVVARHPELIDLNFPRSELVGWRSPWDWMHTNAIDYHPDLDQIMLSPRNFGELWIIDHSTTPEESAGHTGGNGGKGGDLLYRWGNPRSYRAGTVEDQQLFGQHNTHWIPDGLPGAGQHTHLQQRVRVLPRSQLLVHRGDRTAGERVRLPDDVRFRVRSGRTGVDLCHGDADGFLRPVHLGCAKASQRQHADLLRHQRHALRSDAGREDGLEVRQPGDKQGSAAPERTDTGGIQGSRPGGR